MSEAAHIPTIPPELPEANWSRLQVGAGADLAQVSGQAGPATPGTMRHRGLLPLLGTACGFSVANIYYNQPLLLEMARSLHITAARTGAIAMASQTGYAVGILAFVPLGDVIERRGLMVKLFSGLAAAALLAALAPTLGLLVAASALLGLMAAVTHVTVPIAPELARDAERGRAVGTVMTGLLLGILLARTAAGLLGDWLGWRAVYLIAAVVNAAFVPLLLRGFPLLPPAHPLPYRQALRSIWTLIRTERLLQESAVLGALVFGAFSCFWTTLVYLLGSPHYYLGPGVAGSFGVLGATGALIAPMAGRVADRHGSRAVVTLALALLFAGYGVLWTLGYHLAGLVLGVIVLDMGAQANQIANQTRIFGLAPGARGRINTIYMTIYFLGGSLGSLFGAAAWAHYGWSGVCTLGLLFLALAGLCHATGQRTAVFE